MSPGARSAHSPIVHLKDNPARRKSTRLLCGFCMLVGASLIVASFGQALVASVLQFEFSSEFAETRSILMSTGLLIYILASIATAVIAGAPANPRRIIQYIGTLLLLSGMTFLASESDGPITTGHSILVVLIFGIASFFIAATSSESMFARMSPVIEYVLFGHGKAVAAAQIPLFVDVSVRACECKLRREGSEVSTSETVDQ